MRHGGGRSGGRQGAGSTASIWSDEAVTVATLRAFRCGRAARDGGDGQDHSLRRAPGGCWSAASPSPARAARSSASPRSAPRRVAPDPDPPARPQGKRARQDAGDHERAPRGARLQRRPTKSRCDHAVDALTAAIAEPRAGGAEMILIAGASAITDRRDVIPAAIERAGGRDRAFRHARRSRQSAAARPHRRRIDVLGLPGCVRSPKLNGFDWVLQRLMADLPVDAADIMRMGAGGLLKEIPTRPQPRAGEPARGTRHPAAAHRGDGAGRRPLQPHGRGQQAAGGSRRPAHGAPRRGMTALASGAAPVFVVPGHDAAPRARGAARLQGAFRPQSRFRRGHEHLAAPGLRRPAGEMSTAPSSCSATCRGSTRPRSTG